MGVLLVLGAFALVVLLPAIDLPPLLRLKRSGGASGRLKVYRFEVILLWVAALLAAGLMRGTGLLTVVRPQVTPGFAAGAAAAAPLALTGFFGAQIGVGLLCAVLPKFRARYARAFDRLRFLLPVTARERMVWALLALTAGICEEFLYRGFLLQYLRGELAAGPHVPWAWAWLLSSLAFGTAHLYQGLRGVMGATLLGILFGALAIHTGSLLLPMALHALVDLQVLWTYRPGEQEAAA